MRFVSRSPAISRLRPSRHIFPGGWLAVWLLVATAGAAPAEDVPPPLEEHVYLTVDEALHETFPKASRYPAETRRLDEAARQKIRERTGAMTIEDSVVVYRALDKDEALLGYAVVSEELGKYRPITFLVGTTPDFKVERVTILVYRESHGGDVRRTRFLSQYRGKTPESPIQTNRDIINISGATLSVRSLNLGVKKVLGILSEIYDPPPSRKD